MRQAKPIGDLGDLGERPAVWLAASGDTLAYLKPSAYVADNGLSANILSTLSSVGQCRLPVGGCLGWFSFSRHELVLLVGLLSDQSRRGQQVRERYG
jgi:hypothetical protein